MAMYYLWTMRVDSWARLAWGLRMVLVGLGLMVSVGAQAQTKPEYQITPTPTWVRLQTYDEGVADDAQHQSGGVTYLLADMQTSLLDEQQQTYQHYAFRIANVEGLQQSSNIEIRFDPAYQDLQLHAVTVWRGKQAIEQLKSDAVKVLQRERSLEQLMFDGSKTANIFLEGVRVGDVLEYSYTLRGSNPVFAGHMIGEFSVQWGVPVHQVQARLLASSAKLINTRVLRAQLQVQRSVKGGIAEYLWQGKDVAAVHWRDDLPRWHDVQQRMQWSDFPNWNSVVRWAEPLYQLPAVPPQELQALSEQIKARVLTQPERAMEALRWVQKNIRYLGVEVGINTHAPNPPELVLARRYGDCKDKTLLLLTLLHGLGIDAYPVLAHTSYGGTLVNDLPSALSFNHVLAGASIGGSDYWLDATLSPQMGSLSDISQPNYGYILPLRSQVDALLQMVDGPANTYTRRVLTVYDSSAGWDKPVDLTVTTTFEGRSAESMRNQLSQQANDRAQSNLANFYASYYGGLQVLKPFSVYDKTDSNQLFLTEYYRIADFWKKSDDKHMEAYFAAPDVNEFLRNPKTTYREAPLGLFYPVQVTQTLRILVPQSWQLKGGNAKVEDPSFVFESKVHATPGSVVEVDTYHAKKESVEVADMPRYLEQLKKARGQLGYTIVRTME